MSANSPFLPPSKIKDLFISRPQVFFTAVMTLLGAIMALTPRFPFRREFGIIAAVSSISHFLIFIFFRDLSSKFFNVFFFFNLILLGLSIHYSGGILSPYNMLFILILLSGAGYGIKFQISLACAVGTYLAVVAMEFFGILPPVPVSPIDVYQSVPVTMMVVISVLGLFLISNSIYKATVHHLRDTLESEMALKQTLSKQLTRLDAPSQLGLLVNKITHDVRGPIGAIAGFVKLLRTENKLNEDSAKDCDIMLKELNRIANMMSRLLQYARTGESEKQAICPVDLLETVLSVFSFYPGAKRVVIKKNYPTAQPLFIFGNKEELQQVYFNLFKNALEALEQTKESPRIDITILPEKSEVTIELADNGCGMPREIAAKISKEIMSTKKEGSGVGLLIVKEIVEAHQGRLLIESVQDRGTLVRTIFPLYSKITAEKDVAVS